MCSVTGSSCSIMYLLAQQPVRYLPILWSSTFASVNAFKIYQILKERNARVRWATPDQEEIYVEYFLPHGMTPKQFEALEHAAEKIQLPKDTCLIKQGDPMQYVYLIVKGRTRANILGRHLTAASFTPVRTVGGPSGAWVGEMAFLEAYGLKEKAKVSAKTEETPPPPPSANSLYTIVAAEDCVVYRWSHDDMETLMAKSTDMRSAMTRAMTAAIVGKVINFTVSRSARMPTWSTWLDDWRHNAGAQVQVSTYAPPPEEPSDEATPKENLPNYS